MTVSFVLPIGAFSINRMSSRDLRYKTAAYKDWHLQVSYMLEQVPALKVMAAKHNAEGGEFHVEFSATYPPNVFRNKQGEISSKTIDASNYEKVLQYAIFGDFMNINDKFVTRLLSTKRASDCLSLECTITLISSEPAS